jgi:hypothetical protein
MNAPNIRGRRFHASCAHWFGLDARLRAGGVVGSTAAGVGYTLIALYLTLLGRFGWFFVACGFTWLVRDLALLAWMKTKPRES